MGYSRCMDSSTIRFAPRAVRLAIARGLLEQTESGWHGDEHRCVEGGPDHAACASRAGQSTSVQATTRLIGDVPQRLQ